MAHYSGRQYHTDIHGGYAAAGWIPRPGVADFQGECALFSIGRMDVGVCLSNVRRCDISDPVVGTRNVGGVSGYGTRVQGRDGPIRPFAQSTFVPRPLALAAAHQNPASGGPGLYVPPSRRVSQGGGTSGGTGATKKRNKPPKPVKFVAGASHLPNGAGGTNIMNQKAPNLQGCFKGDHASATGTVDAVDTALARLRLHDQQKTKPAAKPIQAIPKRPQDLATSSPLALSNAPKTPTPKIDKSLRLFYKSKAVSTLSVVESKLRGFISNQKAQTMRLEPMGKKSRSKARQLAECFGLDIETMSEGKKKKKKYLYLKRTNNTGVSINEVKIRQLLSPPPGSEEQMDGGNIGAPVVSKPESKPKPKPKGIKEGEVIAIAAPKIDEDNVGHKLLSKMGWKEGDSLGNSGASTDPLLVVMKRTKLGLGAKVAAKKK
ncbi:Heat shock protein Hsp88 [Ceratobasidium theobromae]|uniref:Heat shock protein Hsp88 n=1 Tax=Ceratobasidium theobromae TaxID=1582974 RepID=A0A5N5QBH8_9AGAM|nr:Heat shock protein Hsp88 [Ceratobasidium theobromae]